MVGFHDHMAAMLDYDREKEKERVRPQLEANPPALCTQEYYGGYTRLGDIVWVKDSRYKNGFELQQEEEEKRVNDSILSILGLKK